MNPPAEWGVDSFEDKVLVQLGSTFQVMTAGEAYKLARKVEKESLEVSQYVR